MVIGRCRSLEETLRYAMQVSDICGVTNVSDITGLDDLGVSVVACVRSEARADVVTFGKGRTPVEAEVGARMEALEFHKAEPGNSGVAAHLVSVREFSESAQGAIEDFIPLPGARLSGDQSVGVVSAQNLETGEETLVPAELVFRPAPNLGQRLFGASTNGLAAGNSLEEASLCSLLELIERDVWSLELARQRSQLVDPDSLPNEVDAIRDRVHERGLAFHVRAVPNDYQLPYFTCFLHDPNDLRHSTFNGGWGCAFRAEQAVMQAVMEAVQGRLGLIYGGRTTRTPEETKAEDMAAALQRQVDKVSNASSVVAFSEVPDEEGGSEGGRLEELVPVLRRACGAPIQRVVFTAHDEPLQVTRLVVPGLEHYRVGRARVGRRLREALKAAVAEERGS